MLYTDKLLQELWEGMKYIPFDEDDYGELRISKEYGPFEIGESRDEIWHWFDSRYSKGVVALLYPKKEVN